MAARVSEATPSPPSCPIGTETARGPGGGDRACAVIAPEARARARADATGIDSNLKLKETLPVR